MPMGRIRGLIADGWQHGPVEDNGYFHSVSQNVGGLEVMIRFEEGLNVAGGSGPSSQQVSVEFSGATGLILCSETLRQVARLCA